MLLFARESIVPLWPLLAPLALAHWEEVGHFADIPLEPHYEKYAACEAAGILRAYTVRTPGGLLVGYSTYFVDSAAHHAGSKQAHHDALFLHTGWRKTGHGARFIRWCDEQLTAEGVQAVWFGSHARQPIDGLLGHLGYELADRVFVRRLDRVA